MAMPFQPWRALLLPASFRGAGFYVKGGGFATGRRNVNHQFPKSDTPFTEDMGRRARHWPIAAYVIGPFYQEDRDALIAACEAAGPGTLVHPTLGEMQVNCDTCVPTEAVEHGGRCVFQLAFTEAGALPSSGVAADTQGQSQAASSNLSNSSAASLNNQVAGTNGSGPAAAKDDPGEFSFDGQPSGIPGVVAH